MKHTLVLICLMLFVVSSSASERNLNNFTTLAGAFQPGGLLIGKTLPSAKIHLNKTPIAVAKNGVFVLGFGRDAPLTHELVIEHASSVFRSELILSAREYHAQYITGISKKITHPNPNNVARARQDAIQVKAARALWSEQQHFRQAFIWPASGPVSGVYGSVRYYNGIAGRPHYGLDMAGPHGSDVIAPAAGIVRLFVPDMFYSGGTLIIDHGMGVSSTFLHLSQAVVNTGDVVEQGDLIAKTGNTGRSTGPHLDWRMNWLTERIDPQLLVPKR